MRSVGWRQPYRIYQVKLNDTSGHSHVWSVIIIAGLWVDSLGCKFAIGSSATGSHCNWCTWTNILQRHRGGLNKLIVEVAVITRIQRRYELSLVLARYRSSKCCAGFLEGLLRIEIKTSHSTSFPNQYRRCVLRRLQRTPTRLTHILRSTGDVALIAFCNHW